MNRAEKAIKQHDNTLGVLVILLNGYHLQAVKLQHYHLSTLNKCVK